VIPRIAASKLISTAILAIVAVSIVAMLDYGLVELSGPRLVWATVAITSLYALACGATVGPSSSRASVRRSIRASGWCRPPADPRG